MSIQIIDGFQVNAATPIDNRIVASGSVARNAIPYKYHGLRVYDISDNIPYVWNGSSWLSENASGIVGSGSASRIPLYTSSNVVSNSSLQEVGGGIVRTIDNFGVSRITMNANTGALQATSFNGNGSFITNILGSNINGNSISVSGFGSKIIPSGTTDQVLVSDISFTNWRNLSDVSVGTASIASQVRVTGTDLSNANRPIAFVDTVNITPINNTVKANSNLTYNPLTRTLATGTVSSTRLITSGDVRVGTNLNCVGGLIDVGVTGANRNAYLFSGSTGVTELGSFLNRPIIFSTGNTIISEKVRITSDGNFLIANLGSAAAPAISFTGDSNTGIYSPGGNILSFSTGGGERFRLSTGAASDFNFRSLSGTRQLGLSIYDSGYTVLNMSSGVSSVLDVTGYSSVNLTGKLVVSDNSSGTTNTDTSIFSNTNVNFTGSVIVPITARGTGTSALFMYGLANNANTFIVYNNGSVRNSTNSYLGISDIKLKENIVDATPKLDKLMQVRIVNYNFKENSGHETFKQIGVVAQELENILPGLVEETPDRDEKGEILETTTKSVKYSIFVPMLIKAMQEQQAQIEELKSQVASLINK